MNSPDSTPLIFFVLSIFAIIFIIIAYFLSKNKHTFNEDIFSQAGVTVYFKTGTIVIKGYSYKVEQIKSYRYTTGHGEHGNESRAFIEVQDFKKPVHRITFITPNAASTFLSRLNMAVAKAHDHNPRH